MECLGTFTAQYFKFLSVDPNTIFQFFVFRDHLFRVKAGTALNQLPQVVSHGMVGAPVGLADHAAAGLPTVEQARQLVEETSRTKALSLESPVKSAEYAVADIELAELRKQGLFSKGLKIRIRKGETMPLRFLDPIHEAAAAKLLGQVLGSRYRER